MSLGRLVIAGWVWGWVVPAGAQTPGVAAPETYLYDHAGLGQTGAVVVELEAAVGTRDARPFGEHGVTTGVRGRFGVHDRVTLEVFGGTLRDGQGGQSAGGAVDVYVGVLDEATVGFDLTVGLGELYDYQQVHTPRLHASLGKRLGALHVALPVEVAIPVTTADQPARDPIDLTVGVVGSWGLSEALRVGLEAVGEDLEGFWDDEEAEGGARMVVGPTFWGALVGGWRLKLNLGGVFAATRNPSAPGVDTAAGFLGRFNLGYAF